MFSRVLPWHLPKKGTLNAQAFLGSAGIARKLVEYRRAEVIFTQGDPDETVLYIQNGGVKLSVLSKTGKEAVVVRGGCSEQRAEGYRSCELPTNPDS
jgi:CRP/FNR family cyclic AMP-dependent transcriptional regulator